MAPKLPGQPHFSDILGYVAMVHFSMPYSFFSLGFYSCFFSFPWNSLSPPSHSSRSPISSWILRSYCKGRTFQEVSHDMPIFRVLTTPVLLLSPHLLLSELSLSKLTSNTWDLKILCGKLPHQSYSYLFSQGLAQDSLLNK